MDKEEILDVLLDVDLLSKYSELIPNSYKSTYNQTLGNIKSKLNKLKNEFEENKSKDISMMDNMTKPEYKSIKTFLPSDIYTEIFEDVLDSIIPITDNENSETTLKDLFKAQDKFFLDFIEIYQNLDNEKKISFKKNKNDIPNRGWVKIGEILTNSKIISLDSLKEALEYQNTKSGIFVGEAMIELKLITESILRKSLKAQRWIFKICEK